MRAPVVFRGALAGHAVIAGRAGNAGLAGHVDFACGWVGYRIQFAGFTVVFEACQVKMNGFDDEVENAVNAWMVSMVAQSLAVRTIEERCRLLRQVWRQIGRDPRQLTYAEITVWLARLPSASTKVSYYTHLNAWFMWLVRTDRRLDNPMAKVVPAKRPLNGPRPIGDAHLNAVLASPLQRQTRTRIMFGAFAGFRSFEIADIQGERLDRVTGIYHVTGKGGREDYVPLHPVLLREARLYPSKGYWFPSPTDPRKPVDRRSVAKTITDAFERVGVSMKCHQLRHYFATALLASGVPAPVVQKLMRHANLSTTAIYMGVSIEQQREALDALDMNLIFSQFLFSDDA